MGIVLGGLVDSDKIALWFGTFRENARMTQGRSVGYTS